MEKFFIKGHENHLGPYTVSELEIKQISPDTLVKKGSDEDWVEASQAEELATMFNSDEISFESTAPYWGDFKDDGIQPNGCRQYSAILWDIPWGQSWEQTCYLTPATINGTYFPRPTRCVHDGLHMWGEFDVPVNGGTPTGNDQIPQNVIRETYFVKSSVTQNGQTYYGYKINFFIWRDPANQKMNNCICPIVSFDNSLYARVRAFEGNVNNPAKGFWVFRGKKGQNEFPLGRKNEVGYTEQIEPQFFPENINANMFFQVELFVRRAADIQSLIIGPGHYPLTPTGGIMVPFKS